MEKFLFLQIKKMKILKVISVLIFLCSIASIWFFVMFLGTIGKSRETNDFLYFAVSLVATIHLCVCYYVTMACLIYIDKNKEHSLSKIKIEE